MKGVHAYIRRIAAYNTALPIQYGTCEWFSIATVAIDSNSADPSMLRLWNTFSAVELRELVCDEM